MSDLPPLAPLLAAPRPACPAFGRAVEPVCDASAAAKPCTARSTEPATLAAAASPLAAPHTMAVAALAPPLQLDCSGLLGKTAALLQAQMAHAERPSTAAAVDPQTQLRRVLLMVRGRWNGACYSWAARPQAAAHALFSNAAGRRCLQAAASAARKAGPGEAHLATRAASILGQ